MATHCLAMGYEITELRLGLPGGGVTQLEKNEKKRAFCEIIDDKNSSNDENFEGQSCKTQVVGWPPVCSYRRKNSFNGRELVTKKYVKVSMEGAPFLRKIDLSIHKGYSNLIIALENLFGCFGIGEALQNAEISTYVPIYEDKDGDWMLIGDVPWEMFTESCKKLRIMKRSDADGMGLHTKDFLKGIIIHESTN